MKGTFTLKPPVDLAARAKFSSLTLKKRTWAKKSLIIPCHTDKRFCYYLCRRMAAEWRFFI